MKQDRRIQKSKSALKQALLIIMKKKSFSKITIKELCDKANLNRSTFYANYQNINDILFDIYYDIYLDMSNFLQHLDYDYNIDYNIMQIKNIIDYLKEHQDSFQLLLANNENNMFEQQLTLFYMKKYVKDDSDDKERYQFLYHSIGSFTIICQWFKDGCHLSSMELAKMIYYMSKGTS